MTETQAGPAEAAPDRRDHRLILASRVLGRDVFSKEGERLGFVDDLTIEKESGRTIYAILSFGGFLRIGERFHPVPWPLLSYDPERGAFTVPLDKAALKDAPHYDTDELAALGGPGHLGAGERIFGFYGPYGSVPYW
jgi:sporulation protein YlmC with PRC-barrel domain